MDQQQLLTQLRTGLVMVVQTLDTLIATTNKRPREIIVVSDDDDDNNDEKRVCLTPLQLLDLPDEMLELIQDFIDDYDDLAAWTRCCKRLYKSVTPAEWTSCRLRAGILTTEQVHGFVDRNIRTDIVKALKKHKQFEDRCLYHKMTKGQYVKKLQHDMAFLLEEELRVLFEQTHGDSLDSVFPSGVCQSMYKDDLSVDDVAYHLTHHGNRKIEPAETHYEQDSTEPYVSCPTCFLNFPRFILAHFYADRFRNEGTVCLHPVKHRKFGRIKPHNRPSCLVPVCGCCFTKLKSDKQ
jgi:hypothetical protein